MGEILLKLKQANCHKMRKRLKVSGISITSIYSKSSCRKALIKAPGSRSQVRLSTTAVCCHSGCGFGVFGD